MIDFEALRRENLPAIAQRAGVALKQNGNEWEGLCCFHNERTPSFRIYQKPDSWRYMCFGCGAAGDPVKFVCDAYGVDVKEAVKLITGDVQGNARPPAEPLKPIKDPYAGWKIGRPPEDTSIQVGKPVRVRNLKRNKIVTYEPVAVYPYTDKHDDLIGYVLRLEIDNRKLTPQVWWCTDGTYEGFCTYPHPTPRPLYGLGKLYEFPERQVLIVEGEKCADAANRLLGDKLCATTFMGGGKSVSRTYWQSLAGRSCILWPDFDDPGRMAMFAVTEALKPLGCKIKIIEPLAEDFAFMADPKGADIADLEHLGKEHVADLIRRRIRVID